MNILRKCDQTWKKEASHAKKKTEFLTKNVETHDRGYTIVTKITV
jgi:hypothetical protein